MKNKITALVLSFILSFSFVMPSFALNNLGNNVLALKNGLKQSSTLTQSKKTADLKAFIVFNYPESLEEFDKKEIVVNLLGVGDIKLTSNLLKPTTTSTKVGDYPVEVTTTFEDNLVSEVEIKISNLNRENYKLKFSGNGHKSYTTNNIDLSKANQKVIIQTDNSTFTIGDVNGDGVIDFKDVEILEGKINENSTDRKYDLNGDGIVNINDIAFVNHHIITQGSEVVGAYEYFIDEVVDFSSTEEILKSEGVTISVTNQDGETSTSIEELSKPDSTLTLTKTEAISEESPISIPLEFKEAVEMETIEITAPNGDGSPSAGTVILQLEDGEVIEEDFDQTVSLFSRSSTGTITISLGKRVAVKKMTIKVTEVQGEQGTNFVSVNEVKFLQDIGQNEVETQVSLVTGLQAVALDKKIKVTWDEMPNVTGYKVFYGTSSKTYTKSLSTEVNNITISDLKNYTDYFITVSAVSNEWVGDKCEEVKATPKASKVPNKPDFLSVAQVGDKFVELTWKQPEDALTYSVYMKQSSDESFTKYQENLKATKINIQGLKNNVEYDFYVTAVNEIGESKPSEIVAATPNHPDIEQPNVPTTSKMDNSNIQSIEISRPEHYDSSLYPDGFDPRWLIDEDYSTSWVARRWWDDSYFRVTFKEPIDMNYLVWVPRLDRRLYRGVFGAYTLKFWFEGDNLNGSPTKSLDFGSITHLADDTGFLILPFEKQEKVKKIQIRLKNWNGAPEDVNGSEIIFYHYNDIPERISELFTDETFTELAQGVTQEQINNLIDEVNNVQSFIVSKSSLLKELDLANELLKGNQDALGVIKNGVYSRNGAKDVAKHGISINNYEPLGISASKDQIVNIYAEIPEGENVNLIVTQFYSQANKFNYSIPLKNGRNEIKIKNASDVRNYVGGPLYISYSGDKGDQIRLHAIGGKKIPYLEVSDFYNITEEESKQRIKTFIEDLETYVPKLKGDLKYETSNTVEISIPNVLLSLPANKVLEGIKTGLTTIEEKVQRLYDNILAWEEVIKVAYKVYGIDDYRNNGLETRHNIRYMRMFGNAFMYASGNHIGIGANSVPGLMRGVPTSKLEETDEANGLFGWGIAHEIGHVMDRLGKAEITNNIYSLILQTYDGNNNLFKSRLELNDYYDKIYQKVSRETLQEAGESNDVFVQLGMYWQLHLAYDNAENPIDFYNQVYKKYRTNEYSDFTGMDKFAVVASDIAQKDLTEFFTRYGVKLTEEAKAKMQAYPKEERAIYYLNDESRRQRLKNNDGQVDTTITATSEVNPENEKQVNITITTENDNNILGYEVLRNNKSIAFTKSKEYTDTIGSANNMAFSYAVKPITILGEVKELVDAGQVRIEYDKVLDNSLYTISSQDNILKAVMETPQVVSGILLTLKEGKQMPTQGEFTVEIKSQVNENIDENFTIAKKVNFETTENLSKDKSTKFLTYFNKPEVESTDTRIWSYDAKEIQVSGFENITETFEISFITYPGDNILFNDIAFGKLAKDYKYGEGDDEIIEAGTLIVTGAYRGDPIFNTMKVKGRFLQNSGISEQSSTIERDINGYSLFFAEPIKNEVSTIISDGIFIFVPDIQAEAELQGSSCDLVSVLPTQIKAELYRSDDIYGEVNNRLTSDTIWINTPSIESVPEILID